MNFDKKEKALPLIKVVFYLGDDEWHGYETESVWAEKISGSCCRIQNTPFYAKGISFEDIVFVKERSNGLWFESVSIAAGHSTYRILLDKSIPEAGFQEYWAPIENLGCNYESTDSGKMFLLAVDVPSNVDIHKVYALFERGEQARIWAFEEGHCGHSF